MGSLTRFSRYGHCLAAMLQDLGGTAINYVEAVGLLESGGKVCGIKARHAETGSEFDLPAKSVINACGVFVESTLSMDHQPHNQLVAVSQGMHFVAPQSFLPGNTALMIPENCRWARAVLIPWHGATIVGTTDESVEGAAVEPRANGFGLFCGIIFGVTSATCSRPEEILSVWSGLRPLVKKGHAKTSKPGSYGPSKASTS